MRRAVQTVAFSLAILLASSATPASAQIVRPGGADLAQGQDGPIVPLAPLRDASHERRNLAVDAVGGLHPLAESRPPRMFAGARYWGFFNSAGTRSPVEARAFTVNWLVDGPEDAVLLVKIRGSASPGGAWSEWREAAMTGALVELPALAQFVQVNVTMAGVSAPPLLRSLAVRASPSYVPPTRTEPPAGPSLKPDLRATKVEMRARLIKTNVPDPFMSTNKVTYEGLIGGTTANGHVIAAGDHFVSLPSTRSLNPNDHICCQTYTVDLTYNGVTCYQLPVWDVGPWNIYDDYWNTNSTRDYWGHDPATWGYNNRGDGEAYAAWCCGYHNGYTSSHPGSGGTVIAYTSNASPGTQVNSAAPGNLNGSEIDLSDGTINCLNVPSGALVLVTFGWVPN
jgi:hypothetical protein